MQKLRKRQIVILGNGLGAIAFCRAFRSSYAEITVLTQESNYAPDKVLYSTAAGHIDPAFYARSLRILFSKREDIRIRNETVSRIDTEERKLLLTSGEDPVDYDFLLIGNESQDSPDHTLTINSYSEALRIRKLISEQGELDTVAVRGTGTKAVEIAAAFVNKAQKVMLICSTNTIFPDVNPTSTNKIDYEIRKAGINLLSSSEIDQLQDNKIVIDQKPLVCDLVIESERFCVPQCATDLGLEQIREGKLRTRPDSGIPHQPRLFAFAELCELKDGLGQLVPETEIASVQQSRYLAKILKGKIEAKKGYEIDCPAFIYNHRGTFANLNKTGSVGTIGKKIVKGFPGILLDTLLHKLPVFRLAYGWSGAIAKWFQLLT
jgi:NADH dehydrogenase FAD-containing subunit